MGAASLSVDGCSVLGDDDVQCETDLHDAEPSGRPGTHRATTTIRDMRLSRHEKISSAQGNCSAKSLAALVMSSILPCPPCLPPVMLSVYVWGSGCGGLRGRGQGTFHPPCHILHDHMVLRPEGTSHNKPSLCQLWGRLGSLHTGVFVANNTLCGKQQKQNSRTSGLSLIRTKNKRYTDPVQSFAHRRTSTHPPDLSHPTPSPQPT